MRINHEETQGTKKRPEKTFVLFVSSWLILRGETENDRSRASVINDHTVTSRRIRLGAAGERPGSAAGSALRRGVLLQGEMGLRRRIHPTFQEEPPAGLEETGRGRAHLER